MAALVIGANGKTGVEVVAQLAAAGQEVFAGVRSVDTASARLKVHLVQFDAAQPEAFLHLLRGREAVFFCASATKYEQCKRVDKNGAGAVAKLCKREGVRRFVLVSSQLVHPKNRFNPIRGFLNSLSGLFHKKGLMDFKFEGENLVRASGVEYTIVRPGRLGDGPRTQSPLLLAQTNGSFGKGATSRRADVAALCIQAAASPHAAFTTFECSAIKEPAPAAAPAPNFALLKQRWGEDGNWAPVAGAGAGEGGAAAAAK